MKGTAGPMTSIHHLEEAGLLVSAGGPPEDPLELMQSERLAELMGQLAEWFDWVVIDSPPWCRWLTPAFGCGQRMAF